MPLLPQVVVPAQSRRKVKEEEKAVKTSRVRSRSRSKSPAQKRLVEPPKEGMPEPEEVPVIGTKRGRPKKSPDNIEATLKRLSKAYSFTFIELDDQTHLSPAVGNLPTFP